MHSVEHYQQEFIDYLKRYATVKEPHNLYEPIVYILGLGGKRLRPVLTLMAADIFGGSYKEAMNAALSVEVFHNFSLVHDDIMDDAPLRRGHTTVHEKWDVNTGILSGDAMLIMAYQLFEYYHAETFQALAKLFSVTALQVCEGQQYDVDFETRTDVTVEAYLKMIEYKTAVLVAAALKMGAIVAKASTADQEGIYDYGRNLGIAFQLQDDYLDAFGDPKTFGKQVGGDIIENKKTYLFIKALEFSNASDKAELAQLFSTNPEDVQAKIQKAKHYFVESGAAKATKAAIQKYTNKAFSVLETLDISNDKKELLKAFGNSLMNRTV
ncbi:polyprenyl synthetase family protein [Tamlana fucoidanivorans]|uniref:Polyprenyl synthetase family protein n=1 Tax=Allotamlana fucoidanivorans TaxID=2583814 RepID=A0A5C4SL78_9FLAO|nr:polyprenyl synthetase family protein [Tamlana fucoidanivorans]TNJ44338.1 polyprenyl synthetase family protein [Tamlana fucoidanivorans]